GRRRPGGAPHGSPHRHVVPGHGARLRAGGRDRRRIVHRHELPGIRGDAAGVGGGRARSSVKRYQWKKNGKCTIFDGWSTFGNDDNRTQKAVSKRRREGVEGGCEAFSCRK